MHVGGSYYLLFTWVTDSRACIIHIFVIKEKNRVTIVILTCSCLVRQASCV